MGKKLSEDEIGLYERDGFVCPVEAFSADEARLYLNRLESFEREIFGSRTITFCQKQYGAIVEATRNLIVSV